MHRIMCIWFPQLPLDYRIRHGDPRTDGVFAILSEIKSAYRLTHLSTKAQASGLHAGMNVTDARAVAPDLMTEMADPLRENLLLRALGRWARSLSPWVACIPPDKIFVDIHGCAHLQGGEGAMMRQTSDRLSDMQVTSRIAIADTKGAAQALARFHERALWVAAPGSLRDDLKDLPIAALNIPTPLTHDLRRTGLKTIGQLYGHRSAELARRFGLELPQTLAKTLGHTPDPICPEAEDAVFAARMSLPVPIGLKEDVGAVLERLCRSVCTRLSQAQMGGRQFNLTLRCVDTGDHDLEIRFARPTHDLAMIMRQFERPLDQLKIEFGADWFRLVATVTEPIQAIQTDIIHEQKQGDEVDISSLITTLGNRLGFDRVRRFTPADSHLPDFEFSTLEAVETRPENSWPETYPARPLRFFPPERIETEVAGRPPRKFRWRKTLYETDQASGPERLFPEWWRRQVSPIRDYWYVATVSGERLWLVTFPGLPAPDWYVTGQFA